ncbi:hypothetical protein N7540_000404 [Penicillium herquei]|nr:hypothetical protein N7540_000404 [Penicillium herquei]
MASQHDPELAFTKTQAYKYAKRNNSNIYAEKLNIIITWHHLSTGGDLSVLADIGCSSGNATRPLASSFGEAIGLDPGIQAIKTARQLGGKTALDRPITYVISQAENLGNVINDALPAAQENGGVDLITADMAAHWFDMSRFWIEAARIVKSGGSVALWTHSSLYCHPSTPNADEVQEALSRLERYLSAYELPEHRLSRQYYDNLPLPWNIGNHQVASAFLKSKFTRMEWDRDGVLTDGKNFFYGSEWRTLNELSESLSTDSMVIRWREAYPNLACTDSDCVVHTMKEVKEALGADESPLIETGSGTVLLLFKRT